MLYCPICGNMLAFDEVVRAILHKLHSILCIGVIELTQCAVRCGQPFAQFTCRTCPYVQTLSTVVRSLIRPLLLNLR